MRTFGIACAFLLAAGVAFAQEPSSGSSSSGQSGSSQSGTSQTPAYGSQSHMDKARSGKAWKAEVVSTDATAKTITVRKSEGMTSSSGTSSSSSMANNEMTLSVDPSLESSLSNYTAGEQVRITTKKDSSGKEIVSKIEKASSSLPASGSEPPKK